MLKELVSKLLTQASNLRFLLKENSLFLVVKIVFFKLSKSKKQVFVRIAGHKLYCRLNTPDMAIARQCLTTEFSIFDDLNAGQISGLIVDAGGYIGAAAIYFARRFPGMMIVSIEPSSENFSLLVKNTEQYKNIYPVHGALSPIEDQTVNLSTRKLECGFTILDSSEDCKELKIIESIKTVSLKSLLKQFKIDQIGILKMDIEGAEWDLFQDPEWLNNVGILFVELHERIKPGIEEAFKRCNEGRFICRTGGEKYLSIGPQYFSNKLK